MVLAASGMALPLLMLMAKGLRLRIGRPHDRDLARKWAKATGLLFRPRRGLRDGVTALQQLGLIKVV
jgi:hypothetical protein